MEISEFARELTSSMDAPAEATQKPVSSVAPEEEVIHETEESVQTGEIAQEEGEDVTQEVTASEEEASKQEAEADEEHWKPETLEELAEGLQLDLDALKAIRVRTKVDGVEGEASLAEVIKNYQISKSLTQKSEEVAHMRKQYEQAIEAASQKYNDKLTDIESWNNIAEQLLREQVAAVDWKQLREDDPAEYAAKRQEFTERISELEMMKHRADAARKEAAKEQEMAYLQQYEAMLAANRKALQEQAPEFRSTDGYKKTMDEIKGYLLTQGISEQEINSVYDYRVVLLAKKAMEYDKLKQSASKKPAIQPKKFVKPSARQDETVTATNKKVLEAQRRLKKTGSVKDFANLLLQSGDL